MSELRTLGMLPSPRPFRRMILRLSLGEWDSNHIIYFLPLCGIIVLLVYFER
jgi:hypothetical protein